MTGNWEEKQKIICLSLCCLLPSACSLHCSTTDQLSCVIFHSLRQSSSVQGLKEADIESYSGTYTVAFSKYYLWCNNEYRAALICVFCICLDFSLKALSTVFLVWCPCSLYTQTFGFSRGLWRLSGRWTVSLEVCCGALWFGFFKPSLSSFFLHAVQVSVKSYWVGGQDNSLSMVWCLWPPTSRYCFIITWRLTSPIIPLQAKSGVAHWHL